MDMTQKYLAPPATLPPALRILLRARELISEPEHWCQGPMARRADGHATDPERAEAISFCLIGSLYRARFELGLNSDDSFHAYRAIQNANRPLREAQLARQFNDLLTTRHADVIRALDNAIAAQRPAPRAPWYHRFLPRRAAP